MRRASRGMRTPDRRRRTGDGRVSVIAAPPAGGAASGGPPAGPGFLVKPVTVIRRYRPAEANTGSDTKRVPSISSDSRPSGPTGTSPISVTR